MISGHPRRVRLRARVPHDSFGGRDRAGASGHRHDLAAGTPIVAVHGGNAVTPDDLGGNAVIVYHDGGSDFTYYST
jgi:hypothetical protein